MRDAMHVSRAKEVEPATPENAVLVVCRGTQRSSFVVLTNKISDRNERRSSCKNGSGSGPLSPMHADRKEQRLDDHEPIDVSALLVLFMTPERIRRAAFVDAHQKPMPSVFGH